MILNAQLREFTPTLAFRERVLEELTDRLPAAGAGYGTPRLASMKVHLTPVQCLICGVAALGFAFDLYEIACLPLTVRPALMALGSLNPGSRDFNLWVGLLIYVPLACGGVFGLLGGYLTDLLGRRRVLVWSILLYAFSACAAAFAMTPRQLLIFRCLTIIGTCVEYVAGVAWVAELFSNPKQRDAAGLHAGGHWPGRYSGYGRLLCGGHVRRALSGHSGWTRRVALHLTRWAITRNSAAFDPAFSA